ncbi:jg249, partial [Pararge aegeria aegeria]
EGEPEFCERTTTLLLELACSTNEREVLGSIPRPGQKLVLGFLSKINHYQPKVSTTVSWRSRRGVLSRLYRLLPQTCDANIRFEPTSLHWSIVVGLYTLTIFPLGVGASPSCGMVKDSKNAISLEKKYMSPGRRTLTVAITDDHILYDYWGLATVYFETKLTNLWCGRFLFR